MDCIDPWLKERSDKCPFCKAELSHLEETAEEEEGEEEEMAEEGEEGDGER